MERKMWEMLLFRRARLKELLHNNQERRRDDIIMRRRSLNISFPFAVETFLAAFVCILRRLLPPFHRPTSIPFRPLLYALELDARISSVTKTNFFFISLIT